VPAVALRAGLGEASGELLGSARVLPERLEQAGFSFRYPAITAALAAELSRGQASAA
jgi:NAD dependent epimerase/dehydratase family enzyme